MSFFRSLNTQLEQDEAQSPSLIRPWPATYREPMPRISLDDYVFQIRIENQHARNMNRKQLLALPTFTESRRITSKAGWTYYGQWKGLTFQTLFSLFSTPNLYPWVRLESLNGHTYIIQRQALLNYRLLLDCEGQPITDIYGGPAWVHNFDQYIEYSIPHVKSVVLMQGDHQYQHPHEALGYDLAHARVEPGRYFGIHHEKMVNL